MKYAHLITDVLPLVHFWQTLLRDQRVGIYLKNLISFYVIVQTISLLNHSLVVQCPIPAHVSHSFSQCMLNIFFQDSFGEICIPFDLQRVMYWLSVCPLTSIQTNKIWQPLSLWHFFFFLVSSEKEFLFDRKIVLFIVSKVLSRHFKSLNTDVWIFIKDQII